MSTLSSKAVAEMLGKRHDNFMRNLRSYAATLGESASEYLIESTYKDGKGKVRAGYEITLKGCDLIAGRIIGAKSDEFREKYKPLFSEGEGSEPVKERCTPQEVHCYTTEEAAKVLGCSRRTVQRMIQRGELATQEVTVLVPTVKTLIIPEELDRYQKERAAV